MGDNILQLFQIGIGQLGIPAAQRLYEKYLCKGYKRVINFKNMLEDTFIVVNFVFRTAISSQFNHL